MEFTDTLTPIVDTSVEISPLVSTSSVLISTDTRPIYILAGHGISLLYDEKHKILPVLLNQNIITISNLGELTFNNHVSDDFIAQLLIHPFFFEQNDFSKDKTPETIVCENAHINYNLSNHIPRMLMINMQLSFYDEEKHHGIFKIYRNQPNIQPYENLRDYYFL